MSMSDRLAVLRLGKVEDIGRPEEVYDNPSTEFVAGFLGASNLMDGRVIERGSDYATLEAEGGNVIRVPSGRMNRHEGQQSLKVGVRPEKIRIEPDEGEPEPGWNSVPGVVRMTTYIGVSHQYRVDGPAGKTLTVYAQNMGGGGTAPQSGDRVRLMWHPEHTFVVQPSEPLAEWEEEL